VNPDKNSRDRLVRRARALLVGSAGSQAIAIAISPLLTRLYTADAIGVFGVFMAVGGIAGTVAALRFEVAVVTERDAESRRSLLALCLLFLPLTAILTLLIEFTLHGLGWLRIDHGAMLLSAIYVLAVGAFQVFLNLALGADRAAWISRGQLARAVTTAALQLLMAKFAPGGLALCFATTTGQALGAGLLIGQMRGSHIRPNFAVPQLRSALGRHRHLLQWGVPETLLGNLQQSMTGPVLAGTR